MDGLFSLLYGPGCTVGRELACLPTRWTLSPEPYFAYEPEPRGFFARAGLLLPVDAPVGPPFQRRHVTTVRGTLGGKW